MRAQRELVRRNGQPKVRNGKLWSTYSEDEVSWGVSFFMAFVPNTQDPAPLTLSSLAAVDNLGDG